MTNKVDGNRPANDHKQECNNIYLFLLNKYKRKNRADFNDYVKTVSNMKKDLNWKKLNWEEQQKIISEI